MNKPKRSLAVTLLHWSIVIVVGIGFVSGQRIAGDHLNPPHMIDGVLHPVQSWRDILPSGAVFDWHRASGFLLLAALLGYLLFSVTGNRMRHLRLRAQDNPRQRVNTILIWLGIALLALQSITGILLAVESNTGNWIPGLHRAVSWTLLAYMLAHPLAAFASGGWRRWLTILTGKLSRMWAAVLALLLATLPIYWLGSHFNRSLPVAYVEVPPQVDGDPGDTVWQRAAPATVITRHGNGDRDIPVTIRALHSRDRIYFLLSWPDATPSDRHLQLEKTDRAWRVVSSAFAVDDERTYYEDKLALMLSNQSVFGAMRSIHLGPHPLDDEQPPRHGRGYHFTSDGSRLDIWHWKAARTNPLFQADDQFIGPPMPGTACEKRYTAGYREDPTLGGGFAPNYSFFKRQLTPLRLPADIPRLQSRGWMRWSDGSPYSAAADTRVPVGTRIPGIIDRGPFTGDRGQVGARGQWRDGRWHLEMSRALDTGSPYDSTIGPDTKLWIAVFDNAQTRHSYHLRPLQLRWLP